MNVLVLFCNPCIYVICSNNSYVTFCRNNNNTGHDEDFAANGSLAVQTPAVDFIISNQTVSTA